MMPMRRTHRWPLLLAVWSTLVVGMPGAPAADPGPPEVIDPAGDANHVSDLQGLDPGAVPATGPVQAGWADITKVWITTDHRMVPAERGGVPGREKVPTGFAVHVQLSEPPKGVGHNIAYEVQWSWNNCTYSVVIQLPGAAPESPHAQLYEDCAAGGGQYDLHGPEISGNTVTAHVPFAIDRMFYSLFPGASLAEIQAWAGHYTGGEWPPAYRGITRRHTVIDYAPSDGERGYFELASDLDPRFVPGAGYPGQIITLAGGSHGDGLPAHRAPLAFPRGVEVGPDGLVYISDFFHHRIRRVGQDGRIEPFAGMVIGNGGDGGDALLAHLDRPMGLDFDDAGNLYVADGGNHRIRKITPGRIISTVAGNGVRGFTGDGGSARKARLSFPQDVAVDRDGNVYIADSENARVRRVDAATGKISTYAGGGTAVFTEGAQANTVPISAQSVATAPNGDLYIGGGCRVYKVDAATQAVTRPVNGGCGSGGDGGPAVSAQLGFTIAGLDITDDGRIWISDTSNHLVRVVGTDGVIGRVVGSGGTEANFEDGLSALDAGLSNPWGTALDGDGNLFVVDEGAVGTSGHDRILKVDPQGVLSVFAGTGTWESDIRDGDPATSASFNEITSVAYDPQGRLYVAEAPGTKGGRIWRIDQDQRIYVAVGNGEADQESEPNVDGPGPSSPLAHPSAMDFGPDGRLYFADVGVRQVKVYDPATGRVGVVAGEKSEILFGNQDEEMPADEADLYFPKALAVAPNGDVYWAEAGYGSLTITRIRRLRDGVVKMVAGTVAHGAPGAGFSGDGGPARDAAIGDVHGLEFDADGNLLIADTTNRRVRRIDTVTGRIHTVAGDGAGSNRVGTIDVLSSWTWVDDVVAAPDGGLFVVDSGDRSVDDDFSGSYVDHVAPTGMTSHVAGTGTIDLTGDGPALATPLLQATAADLGPGGLAIADYHRVRLVTTPAGGWPSEPREVRCLPNQTDKAGDARTRMVAGFYSGTNPNTDLRGTEVRTEGSDLVATIRVQDLDPVTAAVHYDPHHQAAGWVLLIWSPGIPEANMGVLNPATRWRYVGAFYPVNLDDPAAAGRVSFDYGSFSSATGIDLRNGTPEGFTLKRLGPATGAADFDKDTLTLRVPLASLGLEAGETITYQNGLTGGLLQYTTGGSANKSMIIADAVPNGQTGRSITIGKNCPDGYA